MKYSSVTSFGLIVVACLVMGAQCVPFPPPPPPPGNGGGNGGGGSGTGGGAVLSYVGSATCAQCHPTIYNTFLNTGHPYKLNRIQNAQVPTYPFSSIEGALALMGDDDAALADGTPDPGVGTDNALGTPLSYADVSYVIGGFGWKARWIDNNGYIVTGSAVQYNLETQAMAAYHNNDTDKQYNCGNCHTTGWKRYTSEDGDSRNLNRQGNLPGMAGTFAEAGVHCEACHGAGSAHVASQSKDDITKNATPRTTADFLADDMAFGKPVACSECHTRHGEKDYPTYEGGVGLIQASGGFIRHHEQYDELLGVDPDNPGAGPTGKKSSMACTTCHDPHKTVVYQDRSGDDPGIKTACPPCHADKVITAGGMQNLECIECHMPRLAKSAVGHDPVGSGPATGDIRSHIFRIDLSKTDQITADGKYAYPWLTPAYACKTCHNGVISIFDFTVEQLSSMTIHN